MRIQTEYMSFKIGWMTSSSNDFLVHQQRSQRRCCVSQTAHLRSEVLQGLLPVLPVLSSVLPGFLAVLPVVYRLVAGMPRCSQVHLKATASVHSTLGFDHPQILVHQLQDTPWHSQRLPEAPRDKNTYCWWSRVCLPSYIRRSDHKADKPPPPASPGVD